MFPILDLPTELVIEVISHLRAFEVERLAQTYNHQIYSLCLPFLQPRFQAARNAKRIQALFEQDCAVEDVQGLADFGMVWAIEGLHRRCGEYSDPPINGRGGTLVNMDYLDLRGDLHWLKEVNPEAEPPMMQIQLEVLDRTLRQPFEELMETLPKLNVHVPAGFEKFIRTFPLEHKTFIDDTSFSLGQLFLTPWMQPPVAPEQDPDPSPRRSYLLKWGYNQGLRDCQYLYLDNHGGEAVIMLDRIAPAHLRQKPPAESSLTPLERELGVQELAHDNWTALWRRPKLLTTNFEEYLARYYFSYWLYKKYYWRRTDLPLNEQLREYLVNVYTENGRSQLQPSETKESSEAKAVGSKQPVRRPDPVRSKLGRLVQRVLPGPSTIFTTSRSE